jgi:hypothetical protein
MKKKDYTVSIIVVVGLFLLTMMLIVATTPARPTQMPAKAKAVIQKPVGADSVLYGGREHIIAIDQMVSGKVAVLSAALNGYGYVVIHKDEKGKPGQIIGTSKMIAPGLYSDRLVNLFESVAPGEMLYATLYRDNGDGVFSSTDDVAVTDSDGTVLMTKFMSII